MEQSVVIIIVTPCTWYMKTSALDTLRRHPARKQSRDFTARSAQVIRGTYAASVSFAELQQQQQPWARRRSRCDIARYFPLSRVNRRDCKVNRVSPCAPYRAAIIENIRDLLKSRGDNCRVSPLPPPPPAVDLQAK